MEDQEIVNGKSCSGDVDKSGTRDLFVFGVKGVYAEEPIEGLPSSSVFEIMAYAKLSALGLLTKGGQGAEQHPWQHPLGPFPVEYAAVVLH